MARRVGETAAQWGGVVRAAPESCQRQSAGFMLAWRHGFGDVVRDEGVVEIENEDRHEELVHVGRGRIFDGSSRHRDRFG